MAKPPSNLIISLLLRTFAHQSHQSQQLQLAPRPFAPSPYKQSTTDLYHWRWSDQRNGHLGFLRSRGFVSDSSGDKKETLAPLVFFGTTGTMLDIIMGITQCEREHAERQAKLLEAQTSATDASFAETGAET